MTKEPKEQCSLEDVHCLLEVQWLLSMNIATSMLSILLVICLVVKLSNSRSTSFNKLTLMPYFYIAGFAFLKMVQYSLTFSYLGRQKYQEVTLIVNTNAGSAAVVALFI